jgi:hypothetical protein
MSEWWKELFKIGKERLGLYAFAIVATPVFLWVNTMDSIELIKRHIEERKQYQEPKVKDVKTPPARPKPWLNMDP